MTKPKSEYCLKMWLKYKPQHATTADGTVVIPKYFLPNQRKRNGHFNRMIKHINRRISEGKLWQAKIYEHPGNMVVFSWTERDGETVGGGLIAMQERIENIESQIQDL